MRCARARSECRKHGSRLAIRLSLMSKARGTRGTGCSRSLVEEHGRAGVAELTRGGETYQ